MTVLDAQNIPSIPFDKSAQNPNEFMDMILHQPLSITIDGEVCFYCVSSEEYEQFITFKEQLKNDD